MTLPIHNVDASLANLARSVLLSVDRTRETTQVQTAGLVLLLERLVAVLDPLPQHAVKQNEQAQRSIRDLVTVVEAAQRDRDIDEKQATGREPPRRSWG